MRIVLAIALAASTLAGAAQAASLSVPVDQSRRLPISGQASNVVVGNTDIADVRVVDASTLMVIGKKAGVTNVVVLDGAGRTLFDDEVQVSAGAGSAVTLFRGAETVEMACSPYCRSVGDGAAASSAPAAPST